MFANVRSETMGIPFYFGIVSFDWQKVWQDDFSTSQILPFSSRRAWPSVAVHKFFYGSVTNPCGFRPGGMCGFVSDQMWSSQRATVATGLESSTGKNSLRYALKTRYSFFPEIVLLLYSSKAQEASEKNLNIILGAPTYARYRRVALRSEGATFEIAALRHRPFFFSYLIRLIKWPFASFPIRTHWRR